MTGALLKKLENLKKIISGCEGAVVAFSGGVDSTLLLSVASEVLGKRVLAVTASSPVVPAWEVDEARKLAETLNVEHMVIETDELDIEEFRSNPPDRCYHCKQDLFSKMTGIAGEKGLPCVLEASNVDDTNDYRPGLRAIRELKIRSPLMEAGFSKEDIRAVSKERGLPTWDKPALACLASRMPYGEEITYGKLEQVARGEEFLVSLGFRACRLRHHGNVARVEVPPGDVARLLDAATRKKLVEHLKSLGFKYVTVDLEGYRSGSMNEELDI